MNDSKNSLPASKPSQKSATSSTSTAASSRSISKVPTSKASALSASRSPSSRPSSAQKPVRSAAPSSRPTAVQKSATTNPPVRGEAYSSVRRDQSEDSAYRNKSKDPDLRYRSDNPARRTQPKDPDLRYRSDNPARRTQPTDTDRRYRSDNPARRTQPKASSRRYQPKSTARRRRPSKRSSRAFRNGLLIYIFILVFISVGILSYLWVSLSKYQNRINAENSQNEYEISVQRAPQLCFESYVDNMTSEDWVNLWYQKYPLLVNSQSSVEEFIGENITSKTPSLWKSPEYSDERPAFVFKADDEPVARFYLSGDGLEWTISDIEFLLSGSESLSFEVPTNTIAYLDDVEIPDNYITSEGKTIPVPSYNDELINPVSYVIYNVDGLLSENHDLSIEPTDSTYTTQMDAKGDYYLALSKSDGMVYQDNADKFIKALLYYYKMGKVDTSANMNSVLSHVAKGSEASKVIKQSYDGVLWRYSYPNITYRTEYSSVYVLADNCYCVDIDYVSNEAEPQAESYRVFFLNLGDGFKIYNFALN